MTFKLLRARDQTRLPSEFRAYPFNGSRDIWGTNKKQTNKKSQTQLKAEPYLRVVKTNKCNVDKHNDNTHSSLEHTK